jgi:hypothetical protein
MRRSRRYSPGSRGNGWDDDAEVQSWRGHSEADTVVLPTEQPATWAPANAHRTARRLLVSIQTCRSNGGLYSPKWISTTCTMLLLRDFGLPGNNRQVRTSCTLLLGTLSALTCA